jgi:plastocyanin
MARWLAVLCACVAFAVAGCGDDEESPDTSAGGGQTATDQTQTPTQVREHEVALKDIKFDPAEITVKQGDLVKWTNEDDVGHDVTVKSGPKKFKSGKSGGMGKGDSFTQSFFAPGDYDYVCTVHANMKGTVKVVK